MKKPTIGNKLAHSFSNVKSPTLDSMIHHKEPLLPNRIIVSYKSLCTSNRYGVSRAYTILPPQRFLKCYDRIRQCLKGVVGLTQAQSEVMMRLLSLWAYYGNVYPKACQIAHVPGRLTMSRYGFIDCHPLEATGEPGCSKATFWRAIRDLKERGLILVVNRYVLRPHAQISNLYRFDKLLLIIARYLAEHGVPFLEKWLEPLLRVSGKVAWKFLNPYPRNKSSPS